MKVKFLKGRKYKGKHYGHGDVVEVDEKTAQLYFLSKAAVEYKEVKKTEVSSNAKPSGKEHKKDY